MLSNVVLYNNLSSLTGLEVATSLNGIVLPLGDVINENYSIKPLIQIKESLKKLSSNFTLHANKNLMLINGVSHRKNIFLYILSKMKALSGIILPETSFTSLNDISQDAFPFIIPFHPGKGPEIDYPDAPVEPEDPDEDPGDEPGDRK